MTSSGYYSVDMISPGVTFPKVPVSMNTMFYCRFEYYIPMGLIKKYNRVIDTFPTPRLKQRLWTHFSLAILSPSGACTLKVGSINRPSNKVGKGFVVIHVARSAKHK
jgi:hypothetical protein